MGDVPETMAAAVYKAAGAIDVEHVPVPEVGADDVLVEIELCGICGSDLHMVLEGWGVPGSWHGHEWIGTIAAVGDGVTTWSPGDRVVGGPGLRCGECRMCKANRPSLCEASGTPGIGVEHGAFASYKLASSSQLLAMPDGIDPRAAALAEPLSVALHGIHQARIEPGQRVLVFGAGPIGALSIAALRALGVDDVHCVEPGESRQALATAIGAVTVRHPEELDLPNMAEPMRVIDDAFDAVLECSGHAKAMEAGLKQLLRGGTLVLVGAGIHPPKFDANRILLNELVITGANTYDHDGFEQALALLTSGKLPIEHLVEAEEVPLEGVLDAMRGLAEGRTAGKVMVRP